MELGDIWVKVANNLKLTQQEQEFLRLEGRNTQLRNTFVAGNTTPQGTIETKYPFEVIFSEILQKDTASLSFQIPAKYKHLFIMGAGRNTGTGGTVNETFARYNDDAGANYTQQKLIIYSTTTAPASYGGQTGCIVGLTANSDLAGGPTKAASFFTILPHCSSNLTKTTIMFGMSGYTNMRMVTTVWGNASPITKITLLDTDVAVSLAAGTSISVYGML